MKIVIYILCLSTCILCLNDVFPHSGGTDSSGGHYNRKTGEYHYHGGGCSRPSTTTKSSTTVTNQTPKVNIEIENDIILIQRIAELTSQLKTTAHAVDLLSRSITQQQAFNTELNSKIIALTDENKTLTRRVDMLIRKVAKIENVIIAYVKENPKPTQYTPPGETQKSLSGIRFKITDVRKYYTSSGMASVRLSVTNGGNKTGSNVRCRVYALKDNIRIDEAEVQFNSGRDFLPSKYFTGWAEFSNIDAHEHYDMLKYRLFWINKQTNQEFSSEANQMP